MAEWREHLNLLPEHMRESVKWWIEKGEPHPTLLGSFLTAVLTNDLLEAFACADAINAASMRQWATFLHTYAPMGCHGSEERLLAWYEAHHAEKEDARYERFVANAQAAQAAVDALLGKPDRERITVELDGRAVDRLRVLGDPAEVLARLADHAQQGVYRPGAWERGWIVQAFGDEFLDLLEQDPDAPHFQRPKAKE